MGKREKKIRKRIRRDAPPKPAVSKQGRMTSSNALCFAASSKSLLFCGNRSHSLRLQNISGDPLSRLQIQISFLSPSLYLPLPFPPLTSIPAEQPAAGSSFTLRSSSRSSKYDDAHCGVPHSPSKSDAFEVSYCKMRASASKGSQHSMG